VSAYDAAYLALAEVLGAPLLTLDQKLARAGGHRARVDMVG
jgi:predicted nucleic acid-binding protein